VETVTLSEAGMPSHNHTFRASGENGDQGSFTGSSALARSRGGNLYQTDTSSNLVDTDARALPDTGGSQAHDNMQPFLAINFIIALQGLYPSRS
jgi:microcystin-dependent protein